MSSFRDSLSTYPVHESQHDLLVPRFVHQEDRLVFAETALGPADPVQAVVALLDAEGDGVAFAAAVGALLCHEDIVAGPEHDLDAAAEVPARCAAIAVEAEHERGVVALVVIAGAEDEPVVGTDLDRFVRDGVSRIDHLADLFAEDVHLGGVGDGVVIVLPVVRRIKDEAIGRVEASEKGCSRREQGGGGHEFAHGILLLSEKAAPGYQEASGCTPCGSRQDRRI